MTILIAGIVGVVGLAAGGWLGGYRVNFTPSYPLGLWRIEALHRNVEVGDLIFICPPPTPQFAMARERGYLRSGLCPGWFSPLIKTVVAVSGQIVEIGPRVVIDGAVLAHSDVHSRDAEGRALVPFAGGVVPAGHLFLFSEFAGSYDSRYFGPIPATGVLGLAHPLLVLDP